ncbi:MAG: cysteine-rich CWC family protein [Burkholderiales bacterium]
MDQPNKNCAECGVLFVCGYALGKKECWCSRDFPAVMTMKNAEAGCYCAACLEKKIASLFAASRAS